MKTTADWEDTKAVLAGISPEVQRVNVLRLGGKQKWIDPSDILDTDLVILKPDGRTPKTMLTAPGRPANPKPLTQQTSQARTAKAHALGRDKLLGLAKKDPENPSVLDLVVLGLAEESASLKWERTQAEGRNEDTSTFSVRRGRLLATIGDQWLKRRDVSSSHMVDMESPAFKALFSYIIDTFRESMKDAGMRGEMIDRVVAKFGNKMGPEWEKAARDVMAGQVT